MKQRADFLATVWFAIGGMVVVGLATGALVLHRYGQWVYRDAGDRIALLVLLAALSILAGCIGGSLLWATMRLLDMVADRLSRRWLMGGCALATVLWFGAMLRETALRVYTSPVGLLLIGVSLLSGVVAARGKRAWIRLDILTLLTAATALAASGCWVNFVYVRRADSLFSGILNGALLVGVGGLACLALLANARHAEGTLSPSSGELGGTHSRKYVVLCGIALIAAISVVPSYRKVALLGVAETGRDATTTPARLARSADSATATPTAAARNVVLISIDTLRADHLGLYGYSLPTSPHIDGFFSNAAVFTTAISQAPWTLPSHVSMVTGQYPSTHGVRVYPTVTRGYVDRLPDSALTLAEMLRDSGFATAGFTGGGYVGKLYHFDQGFDTFGEAESWRMYETLNMALPWLESHADKPFFLFLHSFDVHRYNPPKLYDELSDDGYTGPIRRIRDERPGQVEWYAVADGFYSLEKADVRFLEYLYDQEIRGVDEQLVRLFAALGRLGILNQTAVILTSDHGENFDEHGTTGHAFNLYDPVLHVPLVMRIPGMRRLRRVPGRVQTIDVTPTILELLGVPAPRDSLIEGDSLLQAALGNAPVRDQLILCEADVLDTQAAVYLGRYKYIHPGILSHSLFDPRFVMLSLKGLLSPYAKGEQLFDLASDPEELHNIAATNREMAERYRRLLMAAVQSARRQQNTHGRGSGKMTAELEDQLRSLGYLE